MNKILIINSTFSKGGAAQIAWILHNALKKTVEFTSYFAYGRGSEINDERTFRFASQLEVYFHAFLTRITGLQGYGSYLSTKQLEKFILQEKPDLIHLHNLHGYYLNLSFIKFSGRLNIPIIWTLHDGWSITGRCGYFFECSLWKTGCGNCPNLSWYPKTYFDSSAFMWKKKNNYFTSKWNPIIICPSQWLADKVKHSYLNKFRIKIIPNGIDTEMFRPKDKVGVRKKLGIDPDKKVILFVAADLREERKGVSYFFEALQYIRANNWMVLTAGKRVNLNRKIKMTNIKQLGCISNKNLICDIYNAADISCISSLDEVFGLTVTESMACGIPVAGFKVGGVLEQVTDDCGILVEPRDVKGLGMAIDELLGNDEKRKTFSMRCRERVLGNYSIEKFKERYINLYKSVLP